MKKPFNKDYPLTQSFGNVLIINGVNIYAQFGLKGHNGIDWGLLNGTTVIAPHDGKVIEATLDPKGYGLYVKIENTVEGSVLAHFKELRVGVGDSVYEGQTIALSDNSGNSTGPHLHWGYYRFPRNRNNGYNGFIDQSIYLKEEQPQDALTACLQQHTLLVTELEKTKASLAELLRINDEYDNEIEGLKASLITSENFQKQLSATLNVENQPTSILGSITKLIAESDQLRTTLKENEELKKSNENMALELKQVSEMNVRCQLDLKANREWQGKYEQCASQSRLNRDQLKYKPIISIFGLYICKVLD
jgi:hypothetical protein